MKKLIEFSVNYPVTVLMAVLAVVLLGVFSFNKLGIDLFPNLNNPRIFVELKAGERPPEEIENQFVRNIESQAIRQSGVSQVSSVSMTGSAQITVEYQWDTDMNEAFLDLQKTLTYFTQNNDIDELNITQHNPNDAPVMLITLSHPEIDDMDDLRKIAENYLRNELIRLEGVADIELSGQEEKEVIIETDPSKLEAWNLTPDIITERINTMNRNVSGGSIVELGKKYIIKGVGAFQTLDDLKNLIVAFKKSSTHENLNQNSSTMQNTSPADKIPVFLRDVAEVSFRNKEPENIVRINGQQCIGMAIYKETRCNAVKAVKDLLKTLEGIKKALPGYEFTVVNNQGKFINNTVNEVKQTALLGILLAVIVLYIFLRRIGVTIIISLAIPVSVIATFILMYFQNLTLNIMTLGGIALGAGMLIDNAIVVMENIIRNIESGRSLRESAIQGTDQVSGAITASTITTVVVFLPIVYLHGAAGELFKDQALTVAFSLLSSLLVALFVIPMFSTRLLSDTSNVKQHRSIRFKRYGKILSRIIDIKWIVICLAIILVAAAIRLLPIVGSEFIPRTSSKEFSIDLTLPAGTTLDYTEHTVDYVENAVRTIIGENLEILFSRIGPAVGADSESTSVFEDENTASIKIVLKPDSIKSPEPVIKALSKILDEIPDLEHQFFVEQTALHSTLGTDAAPVVVEIKGEDIDQLEILTSMVKEKMTAVNDLFNIQTSFEDGAPEIEIEVDRLKTGMYDISIEQVSSQLSDLLTGKKSSQWETEGEIKDISVYMPKVDISQLPDVVFHSGDQKLRLSEIADLVITKAPKEIYRRNQQRISRITAHLKKGKPFNHVIREIEKRVNEVILPADYRLQITGEEQKRKDAMKNLQFALFLSVLLVYMVLASQFESLLHPFTILLTIPLAGVGTVFLFYLAGTALNIMAVIGIIMLAGIAVNDSIILVDAINQLKKQGLSRKQAVIEAGQRRIRPIIMTSMTTILALLPLTFGFGEGASLRSPMAMAVIGGLITSTLLTLAVIPCVYTVFDSIRDRMRF